MSLKENLLEIGLCIDNEYLDKYVELIESNRETKREKFKTQKHHVVPRYYYKLNKLDIDNSKENCVSLLYKDHILAHYYLACCTSKYYKYESYHSFLYLYKIIEKRDEIIDNKDSLKIDISQLELFDKIYQEDKELDSNSLKNGKWMTNGIKQQYVKRQYIVYFESIGYHIGKLPFTDKQYKGLYGVIEGNRGKHLTKEHREKISKSNKGRQMPKECREKISKSLTGRTPWNKGLTKDDDRVAKNLKNGFEKTQYKTGNVPWNKNKSDCFSEETLQKMSKARLGKSPANKGKPVSEETKRKISESQKRRLSRKANINE